MIEFSDFLSRCPPGSKKFVRNLVVKTPAFPWPVPDDPPVYLECPSEQCDGFRWFDCILGGDSRMMVGESNFFFLHYRCRNCIKTLKVFALVAWGLTEGQNYGEVLKLGELPPYGPTVPTRVISLIGPEKELFLKGRRAENQGFGIGAFAYYRRIIENQKTRLVDKLIEAAKRLGAGEEQIRQLETAKMETQFSRAMENVKAAIPPELLMNGHNPLALLYRPLSEGIHVKTDEECLALASDIREVLFEFANKIDEALKSRTSLDAAISRLAQSNNAG